MTRRMFVGALGLALAKDVAPIRTVEVFPVTYPVTAYFKFFPKPERPRPQFLAGSFLKRPFHAEGGALRVPTGAGLGVEVDEGKVRNASHG